MSFHQNLILNLAQKNYMSRKTPLAGLNRSTIPNQEIQTADFGVFIQQINFAAEMQCFCSKKFFSKYNLLSD